MRVPPPHPTPGFSWFRASGVSRSASRERSIRSAEQSDRCIECYLKSNAKKLVKTSLRKDRREDDKTDSGRGGDPYQGSTMEESRFVMARRINSPLDRPILNLNQRAEPNGNIRARVRANAPMEGGWRWDGGGGGDTGEMGGKIASVRVMVRWRSREFRG
jgi:hypothetical protein